MNTTELYTPPVEVGINPQLIENNQYWGRWTWNNTMEELREYNLASLDSSPSEQQLINAAYFGYPCKLLSIEKKMPGRTIIFVFSTDGERSLYHNPHGPAIFDLENAGEQLFYLRGQKIGFELWCRLLGLKDSDLLAAKIRYGFVDR